MVDFLPPMYMYEYIMRSKRPDQVATYDTIIYPFDAHIWILIALSIMAQFLTLFVMQNVWSITLGTKKPNDYIFEGSNYRRPRLQWHPPDTDKSVTETRWLYTVSMYPHIFQYMKGGLGHQISVTFTRWLCTVSLQLVSL